MAILMTTVTFYFHRREAPLSHNALVATFLHTPARDSDACGKALLSLSFARFVIA